MSRLYVVESGLSVTGANADHRLAMANHQIPAAAAGLVVELAALGLPLDVPRGLSPPSLPDSVRRRLRVIAKDLLDAGEEALVVPGRRQPPEVHAIALAIHHALGALGRTVMLKEPRDVGWGVPDELRTLAEEMGEGRVETLVVLGGNPVFSVPADTELESALDGVPHVVHLGTHANETWRRADWRLPEAHFLEAWGDARSADGTASIIQPLIAPLYNGRSVIELLGLLTRDQEVAGYGLVRDTWMASILGSSDFESRWSRALHDGVWAESALDDRSVSPVEGALGDALAGATETASVPDDLEIVFVPSPSVFDGRFANNGWLQELPDPVTKLTWDNAALLGPQTAGRLAVKDGDVVRLELGGRSLEAPVRVVPGCATGSISLALGYGRTAAGRVGTGVGVNAHRLRSLDSPYRRNGVGARKTGRRHALAHTQNHWEMEGRDLVREATVAEYQADPRLASDRSESGEHENGVLPLWKEHDFDQGYQWGMTIDLNRCVGCNACVTACQSENNIPVVGKEQVGRGREMHWLRVDTYFSGDPSEPDAVFQPVPCMHCENAPCEQVCPVAATVHDREGLNTMAYNRCIGTRYCSNNCPYKVRRFNFFNYTKDYPETIQMAMNPDVTVRSRGVMEKCTYCVQRINEGKRRAKKEGRPVRDGEIETACQQTCPADAITFGNINDVESRVSQQKADDRNYVLLAELYHKPRTSYLAKLRNPHPEWPV